MTEVRCLLEKRSVLGEGPIWRPRENSLYWIDLKAPAIYCFDVITRQNRQVPAALGKTIGGMVFARDGRMIVVDAEGVHDLNASGHRTLLVNPEADQVGNAFNDAKCDPKGRLWSGTADIGEIRQSGSLYVIEGRGRTTGRVRRIDSGIICSNGPCWSPDDRTFYFADTWTGEIWAYDYDIATGAATNRRTFTRVDTSRGGAADGSTVDAEGYLWNALVYDGRLVRYAPDGSIDRVIDMPVKKITSVMFGGPKLDTLYVTSMAKPPLPRFPGDGVLRGSLFATHEPGEAVALVNAGVPGIHIYRENRDVAVSDADGEALLTGLVPYADNHIAVEPRDYPFNALVTKTDIAVAPPRRGAALADLAPTLRHPLMAQVARAEGALPSGSRVRFDGDDVPLALGHDGQLFIADMTQGKLAEIETGQGRCRVFVTPQDATGPMPKTPPLTCYREPALAY